MAKTTPLNYNQFRIFLDLDGVVADWLGGVCEMMGLNHLHPDTRKMIAGEWDGINKIVNEDFMWAKINSIGADWWANLKLFPWAKDLYASLNAIAPVCFLTQPCEDPLCSAGKVRWIKEHFKTDDFLLGAPKHFCASSNTMLVDDSIKKAEAFVRAGGYAFLWPHSFDLTEEVLAKKAIQDCCRTAVLAKEGSLAAGLIQQAWKPSICVKID